jgi:hypothetical protein
MAEQEDAIVVFTAKSPERIIREGGSQAWKLKPTHARQCDWVVCTQNRQNPDPEFGASEPHGSAFLIGRVSAVVPSEWDRRPDRWMIAISNYARINLPDAWDHGRNPVRYASLKELGISLDGLEFQPIPRPSSREAVLRGQSSLEIVPPELTIAQAKRGLAASFGVEPEAVEITIRG